MGLNGIRECSDRKTTFPEEKAKQLAKILRMVRDHSFEGSLPEVRGLSEEERLALEEKHVVSCLNYAGKELL